MNLSIRPKLKPLSNKMITIISGKYKGQKLVDVNSPQVRPTLARVKKSLLQILEPFEGKTVLDLFSGIGNLGIEAISRGAASVTFVERDIKVFQLLQKNINKICPEDNATLYKMDVRQFFLKNKRKYDIILADPPYGLFEFDFIKESITDILNNKGIFCMEMELTKLMHEDIRIKKYGKTQVVFWRAVS